MRRRFHSGLILATAAVAATGCNKVKDAVKSVEDKLFEEPAYEPVVGEDAASFLHSVAGAAPFDPAALSEAMNVSQAEASKETLALKGLALTADSEEIPAVG